MGAPWGDRVPWIPKEKIPFAVVGADQEHQVNGKRVLGRKTKWGIIEGKGSPWRPQGTGPGCHRGTSQGAAPRGAPLHGGCCPPWHGADPTALCFALQWRTRSTVSSPCCGTCSSGEPGSGSAHRAPPGGSGLPKACRGNTVPSSPGRSHLQDLKDITHNVHYESYRVRRLNESNRPAPSSNNGLPGRDEDGEESNL